MKISVPAGDALFDVSLVVRQWIYTNVLKHDHRGSPLDNAEENVLRVGPLKRDVEPETIAIKRQGGGDILDDEERRDAGNFWFSHVSFHRPFLRTFTRGLLPDPAGQGGRLPDPRRHLRRVDLVVLANVDVAYFLVLGLARGQDAATCRGRTPP